MEVNAGSSIKSFECLSETLELRIGLLAKKKKTALVKVIIEYFNDVGHKGRIQST